MIRTEDVVKSFGKFKALDDVNLNVKKGCVYGIVGPNGAGKTTLIKNLTGIYKPDSGKILISGKEVFENAELKQKMIYIGDDLYFFPSYSVLDTAKLYADVYKNFDWERFYKLKEIFKIDVRKKEV